MPQQILYNVHKRPQLATASSGAFGVRCATAHSIFFNGEFICSPKGLQMNSHECWGAWPRRGVLCEAWKAVPGFKKSPCIARPETRPGYPVSGLVARAWKPRGLPDGFRYAEWLRRPPGPQATGPVGTFHRVSTPSACGWKTLRVSHNRTFRIGSSRGY